ncbi:hypothetical protein ACKKBG_A37205 [Auxenochlorella protothecoides x Auxenochlorella symbiontica]
MPVILCTSGLPVASAPILAAPRPGAWGPNRRKSRRPAPSSAWRPGTLGGDSVPPGAEYGEGLLQFLTPGGATRLDVDRLNEKLRPEGAARCRQSMFPDEAHGLIFDWDDVIADTAGLQLAAWHDLAAQEGLSLEAGMRRRGALLDLRPERAILEVLGWTRDWVRAQALARQLAALYLARVEASPAPLPGAAAWLAAAARHRMPCALVTWLEEGCAARLLEAWGLTSAFQAVIGARMGAETQAERLLCAACALRRPPERCVAFSACPGAVTAAHNCSMRAAAVAGKHPAYALAAADVTVASLADLSVVNVRRLFADAGTQRMDLCKQEARAEGRSRPRRATTGETPT